jgi:tight adherence protein C
MVQYVLPASFAIAAFLFIRGLSGKSSAEPSWREQALGTGAQLTVQKRESPQSALRGRSAIERVVQAPPGFLKPADRLVERAGVAGSVSGASLLGFSIALGVAALAGWTLTHVASGLTGTDLGIAMALGAVGAATPWVLISGHADRRRSSIERALPDVMDLLTASLEAGLALESALTRIASRAQGPLAEELRRTLSEISLGRRRRDALIDFAERVDISSLNTLVSAINQAERTGMQLGQVLRAQSEDLRRKRRQKAEEAAMKAPVKMLLPLVGFIMPTLFIIILGPAGIQLGDTF